jgi:membrane-associated protease RseP (regulator of RpoE activity)
MRTHRGKIVVIACALLVPLAGAALAPADAEAQVTTYRITQRGMLGIMTQGVATPGAPARQRVVMEVVPESPAARAGVQPGDTILRINGLAATDAVMGSPFEVGDTVVLRIRRDGSDRDVTLVAAERTGSFEQFTLHALPDSIMRAVAVRVERMRQHVDSMRLPSIVLEQMRGDSVVVLRFGNDSTHVLRIGPGFEGAIHLDSLRRRFMADTARIRIRADSLREHATRMGERFERFSVMAPELEVFFRGDTSRIFVRGRDTTFFMRPGEIVAAGMNAVAGAQLAELNPGLAEYFGTGDGVLVLNARAGTPAARAGLQAGDVIIRAADAPVNSIPELRRAVERARPGTEITLRVLRRGAEVTLQLTR